MRHRRQGIKPGNALGCLSNVYVLVEYADLDTPPRLTYFDQCDVMV